MRVKTLAKPKAERRSQFSLARARLFTSLANDTLSRCDFWYGTMRPHALEKRLLALLQKSLARSDGGQPAVGTSCLSKRRGLSLLSMIKADRVAITSTALRGFASKVPAWSHSHTAFSRVTKISVENRNR